MCKETKTAGPPRLLLSLDSCALDDQQPPPHVSIAYSGVVIVGGLLASEMLWRLGLEYLQDLHPVLEPELHRQILARHMGVDVLSLGILAVMGWRARSIVWMVFEQWFFGKKGAVAPAAYMNRMFTKHPEATRIAVFFFWYQVKNSYDTLVWNDGPEYVVHHVFSLITSWVAIGSPFMAHFYAVFFLALCEVSTCVLCVLANFDDEHGVPGLGDAFPLTKIAVGAVFVVLFIVCRVLAWPIFAYLFFQDTKLAFAEMHPVMTTERKWWLRFLNVSLTSLSLLQIVFLAQIFLIGKEELTRAGLL
uniref:TLC domain-containing protein n=1 Tax=Entomoneis paludosa TaxID=265537 RepID=A0A7S3DNK8_9STRA|mmetsp:Transcript_23466/g.48723  ORF Transcript_23466/g.48723 Transcript_23466/m.48723 type:complete len:304 (+) Transcript_23466:106-1017(+)